MDQYRCQSLKLKAVSAHRAKKTSNANTGKVWSSCSSGQEWRTDILWEKVSKGERHCPRRGGGASGTLGVKISWSQACHHRENRAMWPTSPPVPGSPWRGRTSSRLYLSNLTSVRYATMCTYMATNRNDADQHRSDEGVNRLEWRALGAMASGWQVPAGIPDTLLGPDSVLASPSLAPGPSLTAQWQHTVTMDTGLPWDCGLRQERSLCYHYASATQHIWSWDKLANKLGHQLVCMTSVKSAEPWTDNSNTVPHTVHLTLFFLLGSPSSPGSGSPVLSFYPHKSALSLQLRKRRTYLCPTSEQPMSHRKATNHRGDREVASPACRRMRTYLLTRGRETQPDYSAKTGHCLNTALRVTYWQPGPFCLWLTTVSQESGGSVSGWGLHGQLATSAWPSHWHSRTVGSSASLWRCWRGRARDGKLCSEQTRRQFKAVLRISLFPLFSAILQSTGKKRGHSVSLLMPMWSQQQPLFHERVTILNYCNALFAANSLGVHDWEGCQHFGSMPKRKQHTHKNCCGLPLTKG